MGKSGRAIPALAIAVALALVAAAPTVAAPSPASAPTSGARASRAWHIHTIVPASQFVEGSQLSVTQSGNAVLAWVQGRPAPVCSQRCPVAAWPGYRVMFAQGTAAGGFGHSHVLSSRGDGGVYAAQLSSGLSYVAWNQSDSPGWRIAAIHHGHVSQPTRLPANAQLQGLYTGHSSQAVAVWVTPGNPKWHVHYAFLGPRANLRRQGDIAKLDAKNFTYPQIAVNDQGDLAAVWTEGPKFTSAELAWCDARGHCVSPRHLNIPDATPYVSVAVTDRGTVAALINARPTSIWTAIAQVGRSRVRIHRLGTGAAPMIVSEGRAGAAAMFSPTHRTLARTFLNPATGRFTRPSAVQDHRANALPELAANLNGQFVSSWFHAHRGSFELRASTGRGITPTPHSRRVVAPANRHPGVVPSTWTGNLSAGAVGLSGRGNAVVSWESMSSTGPHGLYVALHHLG